MARGHGAWRYDDSGPPAQDDPLGLFSARDQAGAGGDPGSTDAPAGSGALGRPVRGGHRRYERPEPVAPARALLGAAVAVCGVLLGVASLLYVTDDPYPRPASVASAAGQRPTASARVPAVPLVALPPVADASAAPPPTFAGGLPTARDASPVAETPFAEGPAGPRPSVVAGRPSATSPATPPPGPPVTPPATPPAAPPATPLATPPASSAAWKPPVTVLNATRTQGVARRAASRIRAEGWPVLAEDNWRRTRMGEPTVFYGSTAQLEPARRLAQAAGATRVLPRIPGLPRSGLTLVVVGD